MNNKNKLFLQGEISTTIFLLNNKEFFLFATFLEEILDLLKFCYLLGNWEGKVDLKF